MHGKLKGNKIRSRRSIWENAILILIGVSAFAFAGAAHNRGVDQKWLTAVFGTLIPFGFVIFAFRLRLLRWSFWASLATCLAIHILLLWAFFQYVLANLQTFPILLWYPVMLIEVIVLLIAVKRIEERLIGHRETIKLSL
jgi:hypothetical protein